MPKPIAPLMCSTDLARRLGAQEIGFAPPSMEARALADFRLGVVDRVNHAGHMPVFGADGLVFAWPVQPGARHSGAGL